ncbi:FdtA/QdtA family cupin domain-containing protein [Sphingomonas sp. KRR8]|uniref:sugar 3,4-ketoisomerase n=1 Tax=Sphingomonas sp. KRR8 TaxID=2942996 RepID=UPI0020208A0B|nr:FdtA/QdtA family cupin domain-containing protein [Sphingomonas sp. KRR8]URD61577.1 FdtA/QdtA family cupin domain-containing protein [Sphingomonas sp. KRR8]
MSELTGTAAWSDDNGVLPGGCRLIPLMVRGDERGLLMPFEGERNVPFAIARVYTVFGTLPGVRRGFHAHRRLQQAAVVVAGACTMLLDDGREQRRIRLDRPEVLLTLPPMVWHEMEDFTPDCVLMVLADAPYSEADYIRDHGEFLRLAGEKA